VRLIDEALALAQERLNAKRAGSSDPASIEGLEQIISGLQYRRDEAVTSGFPGVRLICNAWSGPRSLGIRCTRLRTYA
jgi:hypothetical protein